MSNLSDEASMMPGILDFFGKDYNFDILREWIESNKSRTNRKSLRLLEWFNTNYSKQYNVEYNIKKGSEIRTIYVWDKYNSALSSGYRKRLLDPFGRGKRDGKIICIEHNGTVVQSTLAQLNYFQWAIKNGVIDYVEKHLDVIYNDMIARMPKHHRASSKVNKSMVTATKTLQKHNVHMSIVFTPKNH